jgi:hypothetical protein
MASATYGNRPRNRTIEGHAQVEPGRLGKVPTHTVVWRDVNARDGPAGSELDADRTSVLIADSLAQ